MVNRYRLVVVILILLLIIGGASAAKDKDKEKVANHSYKHVTVNSVIESIKSLLGFEAKENYYEVVIDSKVVAEIPEDSVFVNVTIHESCLQYQYGTRSWYECETEGA